MATGGSRSLKRKPDQASSKRIWYSFGGDQVANREFDFPANSCNVDSCNLRIRLTNTINGREKHGLPVRHNLLLETH